MKKTYWQLAFCLTILFTGPGCFWKSGPPEGKVSGTVTLDEKPLAVGQVIFFCAETGAGDLCLVNESGQYKVGIPLKPGSYAVSVTGLEAIPGGPPVPPTSVPKKYWSAATSKLVCELKEGENTFDIQLKK